GGCRARALRGAVAVLGLGLVVRGGRQGSLVDREVLGVARVGVVVVAGVAGRGGCLAGVGVVAVVDRQRLVETAGTGDVCRARGLRGAGVGMWAGRAGD